MRLVPVKSEETQGAAMVFRIRERLARPRAQAISALRGHLGEFGQIVPQNAANAARLIAIAEDPECRPPADAIAALKVRVAAFAQPETEIGKRDAAVRPGHSPLCSTPWRTMAHWPVVASASSLRNPLVRTGRSHVLRKDREAWTPHFDRHTNPIRRVTGPPGTVWPSRTAIRTSGRRDPTVEAPRQEALPLQLHAAHPVSASRCGRTLGKQPFCASAFRRWPGLAVRKYPTAPSELEPIPRGRPIGRTRGAMNKEVRGCIPDRKPCGRTLRRHKCRNEGRKRIDALLGRLKDRRPGPPDATGTRRNGRALRARKSAGLTS
jgi:hypothetical protein